MTEKEAIDNFNFFNEGEYITEEMAESKVIVLNLIEKNQNRIQDLEKALIDEDYKHRQEIEKIKKELESLKDFKDIAENKVTELNPIGLARANQLLSRQCHNLQEEIEKKDEIIDEMTKYIASLDIEEDICSKTGRLGECDSMAYRECENCIKEYFKKKVEDK